MLSAMVLRAASGRSSATQPSSRCCSRTGRSASSIRPASILDRSSRPLTSESRCPPALCRMPTCSRWSGARRWSSSSTCAKPRMPFSGVRSSCDMRARKAMRAAPAAAAASRADASSPIAVLSAVISVRMPTVPPSGVRRSVISTQRPSGSRRSIGGMSPRWNSLVRRTKASMSGPACGYWPRRAPSRRMSSKAAPGTISGALTR